MTDFSNKKIVITGANGGIGQLICENLAHEKAELILISQDEASLQALCQRMKNMGCKADYIQADFSTIAGITEIASIISEIDHIDMLINLAGMMSFNSLGLESIDHIEKIYHVNVLAPVILTRALLPQMVARKSGHIVNIGSIFGSISFPYFSLYSSSKAAIRSFSESLMRELDGCGVKVSYIAPRAVATKMNGGMIDEYLKKTKSNVDDASKIAKKIISIIKKEKKFSYIGFPEKLFVRLNYLCPSLVSAGIQNQTNIAKEILMNQSK